jgi:hypothetical protein
MIAAMLSSKMIKICVAICNLYVFIIYVGKVGPLRVFVEAFHFFGHQVLETLELVLECCLASVAETLKDSEFDAGLDHSYSKGLRHISSCVSEKLLLRAKALGFEVCH